MADFADSKLDVNDNSLAGSVDAGRKLPFVTFGGFSTLATCYADLTGRDKPFAVLIRLFFESSTLPTCTPLHFFGAENNYLKEHDK